MQKIDEGPGDGLTEVQSGANGDMVRMHTHIAGHCITTVDFEATVNEAERDFASMLNTLAAVAGVKPFIEGRFLVTTVDLESEESMPGVLEWFATAPDAAAGHVAAVKRFMS